MGGRGQSLRNRNRKVALNPQESADLALIAPAIVGTDIAAILALSFGSSKRWVMMWITISLALWTIVLAVGSYCGFGYMNLLRTQG
mgnify:CR=1 FL=1